jgi:hypothetical protein
VREAELLPLRRLLPEHVTAWLRDAMPEADVASQAAGVVSVTEGQPLFVVEALRLGADCDGRSRMDARPARRARRAIESVVGGDRGVLEVAAVLGREFGADQISPCDHSRDRGSSSLREAATISIVVPSAEAERFRFSHVLLRDRLYGELRPSQRAELHFRSARLPPIAATPSSRPTTCSKE